MVLDPISSLYTTATAAKFRPPETTRGASNAPPLRNAPLSREQCRDTPGVRVPLEVRDTLLPKSPLARSIVEHFTGVAGWLTAVSQDQCDGRGGKASLDATLTFFGRSAGTIVGASGAAALSLAAIASGTAPFLFGGLALAGGVLVISPAIGERGVKLLSRLGALVLKSP